MITGVTLVTQGIVEFIIQQLVMEHNHEANQVNDLQLDNVPKITDYKGDHEQDMTMSVEKMKQFGKASGSAFSISHTVSIACATVCI